MDWLSEKAIRLVELAVSAAIGSILAAFGFVRRVDSLQAKILGLEARMDTNDKHRDSQHAETQTSLENVRRDIRGLTDSIIQLVGGKH